MIQLAVVPILKTLSLAGGIFKIGKIFWNLPTLLRLGKSTIPMLSTIVREQRLPHLAECRDLIHASVDLLRSGVIDIPGVDEEQVAATLEKIDREIEWPAQAA